MRVEDRVIPARFLVTMGHLVAVLMVFKTKSDNVHAGLATDPSATEVAKAVQDVNVSWFGWNVSDRRAILKCDMSQVVIHGTKSPKAERILEGMSQSSRKTSLKQTRFRSFVRA